MRSRARTLALVLTVAAATGLSVLLAPTPVHAQGARVCGVYTAVSGAAGVVRYAMNDGTFGGAVGVDFSLASPSAAFSVGYRKLFLEGDGSDPDVLRGAAALPVAELGGLDVCATGHVGATRFTFEDDPGTVLAGGLGARLVSPGAFRPWVGVRAMAARAVGTVLGLSLDATGLSLGLEAGAALDAGPLTLRLTATWDGFDDGLGATPYPSNTAELAIDYRL